ncbi:glycosyltransferase family 2 protein (plasmid) [Azospirillum sp. A29]|uniref:glycosyltransferase n=1 Tax=Azospirillum sp. A29 TaxID=3160606 RepID=UPI003670CDEF
MISEIPKYPHSFFSLNIANFATGRHFDEIINGVAKGVESEGHRVTYENVTECDASINLVFGANIVCEQNPNIVFQNNTVIFNLEQLRHVPRWATSAYVDVLTHHVVWDYSVDNINFLISKGARNVFHVPIGASTSFNLNINEKAEKLFDVLILGCHSPRRQFIVNKLRENGYSVLQQTESWGEERNAAIESCKIILNIHVNEKALLETTRLEIALSNKVPAISEYAEDMDVVNQYAEFVKFCDYKNICKTIRETLNEYDSYRSALDVKLSARDSTEFAQSIARALRISSKVIKDSEHDINVHSLNNKNYLKDGSYSFTTEEISELIRDGRYRLALDVSYRIDNHIMRIAYVKTIQCALEQYHLIDSVIDALITARRSGIELHPLSPLLAQITNVHIITDEQISIISSFIDATIAKGMIGGEGLLQYARYYLRIQQPHLAFACVIRYHAHKNSLEAVLTDVSSCRLPPLLIDSSIAMVESALANWPLPHREVVHAHLLWHANRTGEAATIYKRIAMADLPVPILEKIASRLWAFGEFAHATNVAGRAFALGSVSADVFRISQASSSLVPALPNWVRKSNKNRLGSAQHTVDLSYSQFVSSAEMVPVVAILAVYNEIDIIRASIEKLAEENVEIYVIDNWSNDGTFEILSDFHKRGVIELERFPSGGPTDEYQWQFLLKRKEEIALRYVGYWVVHQDADEIRRSPWPKMGLRQAFWVAQKSGYTAVDYCVLNFRPIDDGYQMTMDPESYFRFFEPGSSSDLRYQVKAWKQPSQRVDLHSTGGHNVRFSSKVVFPYRFIMKHYPIRSSWQAHKKVYQERISRFSAEERAIGWHTHYDSQLEKLTSVWNWRELIRYDEEIFYELIYNHFKISTN